MPCFSSAMVASLEASPSSSEPPSHPGFDRLRSSATFCQKGFEVHPDTSCDDAAHGLLGMTP